MITEFDKAYNYVYKQRKKAPRCAVCNKVLFDYNSCLDIYFKNKGSVEAPAIYKKMFYAYPFKSEDVYKGAKHHISYVKNITIDVCSPCHAKIHNSNEEKYKKFRRKY